MSVYETIMSRVPAATPAGKRNVINTIVRAAMNLKDAQAAVAHRDELSPKGRAAIVETHAKIAGTILRKARRQFDYHAGQMEKNRAAVHAKALGDHDPLDAERRALLRSMPLAERTRTVVDDASFRAAALRGGEILSGITPEVYSHALEIASRDSAPTAVAALSVAGEAQTVHDVALKILARELSETAFTVEPNGSVRKFNSPHELESWLEKEISPLRHDAAEQAEIDATT